MSDIKILDTALQPWLEYARCVAIATLLVYGEFRMRAAFSSLRGRLWTVIAVAVLAGLAILAFANSLIEGR